VLDEFGLVICGWSAEWDEALRTSFERCKSRRFTTYWASRGTLTDAAERLIKLRGAVVVPILGADHFFEDLRQKTEALAAHDAPHPLSAKTAVVTLKRYLSEDRHRIALHDLIKDEAERVMEATTDARMPVS
jgi:hypothetical protein